jgi:hypothetical protein
MGEAKRRAMLARENGQGIPAGAQAPPKWAVVPVKVPEVALPTMVKVLEDVNAARAAMGQAPMEGELFLTWCLRRGCELAAKEVATLRAQGVGKRVLTVAEATAGGFDLGAACEQFDQRVLGGGWR